MLVPLSGPGSAFACELTPHVEGQRQLTVGYSGSPKHLPSEAAPIQLAVLNLLFRNGFAPGK